MPDVATKIDDATMEVVKTIPATMTAVRYERSWLERQRKAIAASRDAELDEVDALLAEMDKLGIVASAAGDVKP
jgi:hypothetical protein